MNNHLQWGHRKFTFGSFRVFIQMSTCLSGRVWDSVTDREVMRNDVIALSRVSVSFWKKDFLHFFHVSKHVSTQTAIQSSTHCDILAVHHESPGIVREYQIQPSFFLGQKTKYRSFKHVTFPAGNAPPDWPIRCFRSEMASDLR